LSGGIPQKVLPTFDKFFPVLEPRGLQNMQEMEIPLWLFELNGNAVKEFFL
jgi:hypothetical protein